jgi:hypothetical protein
LNLTFDHLGAIILLEERFQQRKNIAGLSKWVQKLCKVHNQGFGMAMNSLQAFTQGRIDIDNGLAVDIDR